MIIGDSLRKLESLRLCKTPDQAQQEAVPRSHVLASPVAKATEWGQAEGLLQTLKSVYPFRTKNRLQHLYNFSSQYKALHDPLNDSLVSGESKLCRSVTRITLVSHLSTAFF